MYLTENELKNTYCLEAITMPAGDVTKFLARANAYAQGVVGGPLPSEKIDDGLKTAVAMAFEIFAEGDSAQTDITTGTITEVAPAGYYYRSKTTDPLTKVDKMLQPYADYYKASNTTTGEKGFMFLGRA